MDIIGTPSPTKGGTLVAADVMVLLGFILAVVAVLTLGIYLGWRVSRHRRDERNRQIQGLHLADRDEEERGEGRSGKRRVRRRRRDHRPRNPTLAEAGGLPPQRTDNGRSPADPRKFS